MRFLGLYALILIATTATIIVIEMLLNLDDMLAAHHGHGGPVAYLLVRIPSYYLRELVPITAFAASFFTVALSAQRFEISAAKAGGISAHRLLSPILAAALLLGLAGFAVGESWIVESTREWNRRESEARPDFSHHEGSSWYRRGRTIYNISSGEPSQRTLRGVHVYDLSPVGRLVRRIDAERVDVEDSRHWRFHDASIRRFDPDRPERGVDIVHPDAITLEVANRDDIALINAAPQSLSIPKLLDHIDLREAAGEDAHRVEAVLYARLADPIVVLLFALLALPLGLEVHERRSFGVPGVWGIAIVATYFAMRNVNIALASEGVVSAAVGTGTLLAVFATVGLARFRFIGS